ncbi:xylose import ATP-binding protein XylG [Striga asiatica]|uniref:Xylose import ATP-binding protein XylG n=1 Tax=Striga asiatica TaxID=4170 RepID=A0A5A7Q246_STRAF|nr:xylose import ATP-binding protein XylG [Striga asiatica]
MVVKQWTGKSVPFEAAEETDAQGMRRIHSEMLMCHLAYSPNPLSRDILSEHHSLDLEQEKQDLYSRYFPISISGRQPFIVKIEPFKPCSAPYRINGYRASV